MSAYLATFWLMRLLSGPSPFRPVYVMALLSAVSATMVCNSILDRGRWRIGFVVPPRLALREFGLGIVFAAVLIGIADRLIILFSDLRHAAGYGFPAEELLLVFIPAAVHEELVFRGYPYQKIRAVSRVLAIASTSLVFAALHTANAGATPLAIVNIAVAGVMLALAYDLFERLWFPIGIHLAWNVISGPILGYPVSGYVSPQTTLRTIVRGAPAVTGGTFGIEASIVMLVVESCAIVLLLGANRMRAERT